MMLLDVSCCSAHKHFPITTRKKQMHFVLQHVHDDVYIRDSAVKVKRRDPANPTSTGFFLKGYIHRIYGRVLKYTSYTTHPFSLKEL